MGVTHVLPRGAPLTYDDLQAMPDDGHRYELVDGTLIVTPAPRRLHQRAVGNLIVLLNGAAPEHLEVLPGPFDYVATPHTVLQPDLIVGRRDDFDEKNIRRTPLLVVEVQSSSTARVDRGTKRLAFEAAGVPSYWLVDPEEPSLTALELEGDSYREITHVVGGEVFDATRPFPVTVIPAQLVH